MFRLMQRALCAFVRARSGVAAVEFALIAPLMITTYFGANELCNLLLSNRKVTDVTSSTADLVAQTKSISNDDMTDIFAASTAIMTPFPLTSLEIVVSSVVADEDGNTTVDWSDGYNAAAYAHGSSYNLPEGLIDPNGSVIVSEVTYTYQSPVGEFWTGGFTFHDTFYEKPRLVAKIPWNS